MSPKEYKEVYLEYRDHHPQAITLEAYEQIVEIIKTNLICMYCCKGYTDQMPQVAENVCLACFLKHRDSPPSDLTFVGEASSDFDREHGYKRYKFLDSRGFVYLRYSTDGINDTWERDIRATLMHYSFTVPDAYTLKTGSVVALVASAWKQIYGDFKTFPVLLVTYSEYYGNHIKAVWLLYKDGTYVEFTRRVKKLRTWYDEAKAEIVATWKPYQGYVVSTGADGEDRTAYTIEDHHLYPGIVARATAAYTNAQQ